MRFRLPVLLSFLFFASSTFAIERWVLISGTVGSFHTDARVLNPSFTKDIQITATFFATDGTTAPGTLPVTKRQMSILNDVTTQLFSTDKLGAIKFTSDDEFEVTSRIYAITPAGTLGQFGPGLPQSAAKNRGALLQLRSTGSGFRTNIGAVNPNSSGASVTWTLYSKSNAVVGSKTTTLAANGVLGPTNMAGGFFFDVGSADISDAWVSYSSDQPLLVYASVVDNGTTDQTFVPAVDDKGVPPTIPAPTTKEFTVSLQDFSITFSPAPTNIVKGDRVTLHIDADSPHTFRMFGPTGQIVADVGSGSSDRSFTADVDGLYQYTCNNTSCGVGHVQMNGSFSVGKESEEPPGKGY